MKNAKKFAVDYNKLLHLSSSAILRRMITLLHADILQADFTNVPPINLVVTSPPYNVGIEYDKHDDTMTYPEYLKWCYLWLKKLYDHMPDDGRLCINLPFTINPEHLNKERETESEHIQYPVVADYTNVCVSAKFKYWRTLVWDKNHSNKTCWGSWKSASAPFMRDPSEAILVFYKNQWKRINKGTSTISGPNFMSWTKNVWKIHPETKSAHPAAFPIELPNRCIQLFFYKGDTVLDCFLGSGTTGESAVRLERNFVGVEKSDNYFQMAKERIEGAELQASLIKQVMPSAPIDHKTDSEEIW